MPESHSLYVPTIHNLGVHGQCTTTHTSQAAPPLSFGSQDSLMSRCEAVDGTYADEQISLYPSGIATVLLTPSPAILSSLDDRGSIVLNGQTDRLVTSDVDAIASVLIRSLVRSTSCQLAAFRASATCSIVHRNRTSTSNPSCRMKVPTLHMSMQLQSGRPNPQSTLFMDGI